MAMTVLIFGWEFPSHISGGLGTACYGLTRLLIEEGTRVLFVVPKAHGDESIPMINASEVTIDTSEPKDHSPSGLSKSKEDFLKIEVSSAIVPYELEESWTTAATLTRWNYQVE